MYLGSFILMDLHNLGNGVYHILLGSKLNIIDENFIKSFNSFVDQIDAVDGPKSLVVSASSPSGTFSAGLNLKLLMSGKDVSKYLDDYSSMLARIMRLGFPNICVVDGKCIAGGVFFSCAFDYRICTERTFFYANELDNNVSIPVSVLKPVLARIRPDKMIALTAYAEKTYPKEALECWLVQEVAPDAETAFESAKKRATRLAPKGAKMNMKSIKENLYSKL